MRLAELLLACFPFLPERTAAVILAEFDAVRYPAMSNGDTPEALAAFEREVLEAAQQQQALALELARDHRDHPRVAEVLRTRWTLFSTVQADGATVLRETDEWLESSADPALAAAAAGTRALAAVTVPDFDPAQRLALVREALRIAPSESLVGVALLDLVKRHTADLELQRELAGLARKEFATAAYLADDLALVEQLLPRVGQPLALEFAGAAADATEGAPRSLADWRGRACLFHARAHFGEWVSPEEQAERSLFAQLRRRHDAAELPCLTLCSVYDTTSAASLFANVAERGFEPPIWIDRATFERSLLREQLGLRHDGVWLLIDAEGVLRAWSFRLAPLLPEIEELLADPPAAAPTPKPKKRRAI